MVVQRLHHRQGNHACTAHSTLDTTDTDTNPLSDLVRPWLHQECDPSLPPPHQCIRITARGASPRPPDISHIPAHRASPSRHSLHSHSHCAHVHVLTTHNPSLRRTFHKYRKQPPDPIILTNSIAIHYGRVMDYEKARKGFIMNNVYSLTKIRLNAKSTVQMHSTHFLN